MSAPAGVGSRTGSGIAFTTYGTDDGVPVLFANALGAPADHWWPQVAALHGTYQCITWDYWGHGASELTDGPYTLAALTDAADEILDALGVDTFHVCGVSIGGMIALELAALNPERALSLTLINTPSTQSDPTFWADRAARVRENGMASLGSIADRWFSQDFIAAHPDDVARVTGPLADVDPEGYAACCEVVARADVRDVAETIRCPTLVIAGDADLAVPSTHSDILATTIPGASLVVIDEGSHLLNVEHAEQVTQLLRGHLGAVPAPG